MTTAAILVAAGSGQRLAAGVPKAFCRVGDRTLLEHCYARFAGHRDVRDVLVAVPASHLDAADGMPGATTIAGGATRRESVALCLDAVADDVDVVLVHDVARPFVPDAVISRVIDAVVGGAAAAIPVLPVEDTVKRVDHGLVTETLVRAELRIVQTPQGFRRAVLLAAHAAAVADATDDAGLVEACGVPVCVVDGAPECFKITRPFDLALAEIFAAGLAKR